MKILIAEDDRTSHRVLKPVLEKARYSVPNAWKGTEAWQNPQSPGHTRFAVFDRMIPELDGVVNLVRRVRANWTLSSPYVILSTDKGTQGYWQRVDDYLMKYSNTAFRHTLSHDFLKKHYPEHEKIKAKTGT